MAFHTSRVLRPSRLPAARSPKPLHIAVEGCIGAGKTTLAKKLARVRRGKLLLEAFESHPFLKEFYANPAENAFETEMHFLLLHYHQLKALSPECETITDFTFLKDKVFADLTLRHAKESAMFNALYRFLLKRIPKPHVLIYLKASDDLIIERIRKRNRSIEKEAQENYFRRLRKQFDRFFLSYKPNLLVVEADRFDCVRDPNHILELSRRIDRSLCTGKC